MKICLHSTNEEYTRLALETYLSGVEGVEISKQISPTPDKIIFHDWAFLFPNNSVELVLSHIEKYGRHYSHRSPMLFNDADGIIFFRAVGVLPYDYTSNRPNLREYRLGIQLDSEQKQSLNLYLLLKMKDVLRFKNIDNFEKYNQHREYYRTDYITHRYDQPDAKYTYISNLLGAEIVSKDDIPDMVSLFKAYNGLA